MTIAILSLVVGLLAVQRGPTTAVSGARISELVQAMLTGNDAQEARAIAEARGIFKSRGLPTIGEVGDEAAYSFIVLICTGERDVRASVLSKAKEAARRGQLPSDAVRYCEARIRLDDAIVQARGRAPTRPQLRDEIQRLFAADQAVRRQADFDFEKMMQVDREHAPIVSAIFERYGLPTYSMVGPEAASNFVTLVQHQSPELRHRVLPQLKAAVEAGHADPTQYANLYDRSQRDAGRVQLYGQNLECSPQSPTLHRAPIEDEANVNVRRATIGLVRLELYERVVIDTTSLTCGSAAQGK